MQKAQANVTGRKPLGVSALRLLTTPDVADQLRVSVSSLTKWRMRGLGPAFVKLGSRVAYTQQALDDYVDAGTHKSPAAGAPKTA